MKVLLDNKRFIEGEKIDALSNTFIDDSLPKVRLLLKVYDRYIKTNIKIF